ncbi:hypothetical protein D7252_19710 [Microbacterium sp. CGR2]|nr:hypothetical protein D7252_19710 [Microbacterium sp. CGR2]
MAFGLEAQSVFLGLFLFPLWGGRLGHRPYFENYTVDASILQHGLRIVLHKMILKIISQFFRFGLRTGRVLIQTHVISSL